MALVCRNLIKVYFKVRDSYAITQHIEDKNWKMSELVDMALQANSIREYIEIIEAKAPDFYRVERVNIY